MTRTLIQPPISRVDSPMTALTAASNRDPALRLLADAAASFEPPPASLDGEIGGALLENEDPAATPDDALAQVMAKIELLETAAPDDPLSREAMALPSAVRDAVLEATAKGSRWKKPVRGIATLALPGYGGAEVQLIRAEPGFGPPHHDHAGQEYALILTGAYHDGHERYPAGELQVSVPGYNHRPVAEPGEVCFVLGVTYGRLRFTGLFGLAQRVLRF